MKGDKEMARIKVEVTMQNIYRYEAPAYGYGYETRYIYTMQDAEGTVYVWKTTSILFEKVETDGNDYVKMDSNGTKYIWNLINKGDKLVITASVKGQGEYKGQPQTELTRVKVVERTFKAKTWEEITAEKEAEKEARKQEQKDSVKDGDMVWKMPYKQYKEHYSDCETVIDSFERVRGNAVIEVIIREGRLKASGVRGKHFKGFEITFTENGKPGRTCYSAVCEENALKRAEKDFPEATGFECVRVYA